jgi:hypothetical protein
MRRSTIATVAGLAGFGLYIAVAMIVADHVLPLHWTVQVAYFIIAGVAWVMPIRWLMLWGAHKRG